MARHEDDDFVPEEVERRREPRGFFEDLEVELSGKVSGTFPVVEASFRGFFVTDDEPDRHALGEVYQAVLRGRVAEVSCRLEVIRKEIEPRRGVALRIAFIDPVNEERLRELLGPAAG